MAWHKQYGKVVRLGPNRISVADKDMVQQVLMTDDFPKGPSYNRLQSKKESKPLSNFKYLSYSY